VLRDLQRIKEALGLRPGANVVAADPAPSVPPGPREPTLGIPEPQLKTPEPQLRPEPQIRPEPQMRTPEPPRFRDRAPMHDAPVPAWHDPGLNVGGPRFHEARPMNYRDPRPMSYRARVREPRSASRTPVLATLALLLAVLSIGLTVFLNSPDLGERLLASLNPQAPARYVAPPSLTTPPPPAASSSSTTPPLATQAIEHPSIAPPAPPLPPAADNPKPEEAPTIASAPDSSAAKPPEQAPNPPAQPRTLPPPEPAQTAKAITAPPREAPQAKPTANVAESQPGGTAKLTIAVAPRGEIYIDGQHKGTTPPITTLDLEPGLHRIEIRHGSRRPYLTYINVQSGDQRRIRYDFDARGHPPA
jgi:outer membrane biosynthesis protein TonB